MPIVRQGGLFSLFFLFFFAPGITSETQPRCGCTVRLYCSTKADNQEATSEPLSICLCPAAIQKNKHKTFRQFPFSVTCTGRAPATLWLSARDRDRTSVPVSAIRPPRSTLSLPLPLRACPHPPCTCDDRRLKPSPGDSPRGKYDTTGEPYDDDSDGGGTLGYVSACTPPYTPLPGTMPDRTDDGVVICVPLLIRLPLPGTCADIIGDNGNGDSVDEGECDKGVVVSDALFTGRWIDDDGLGIGTPCIGIGILALGATDVALGDDTPDTDRRCIGCENGSSGVSPTRLSTDNPS